MKLVEIQKLLDAQVLCGDDYLERDIKTCFACDLISEMLLYVTPRSLLVTSLMNAHVIHTAEVMDAIGVIFVGGKRPNDSIIKIGTANGIPLLTTPFLMFECCGKLYAQGIMGNKKSLF